MKTQKISKKDLAMLYSKVCDGWKKRIADTLIEQIDNKDIEVSETVLKEAFSAANNDQKKLLEKYFEFKISSKINDLKDVFKYHGIKESEALGFKNPKTPFERYINACTLIPLIVEAYNDGEKLDWNNNSQCKYLPYYKKASRGWVYDSYCSWDGTLLWFGFSSL